MRTVLRGTSHTVLSALITLSLLPMAADAQGTPAGEKPTAAPAAKPSEKPAEKFQLTYRAEKGRTRRSKGESRFSFTPGGGTKVEIEGKETVKRTYTDIAANGDITYEEITEESETRWNGQKNPADDEANKYTETYTIRPNGLLIRFKTTDPDYKEDPNHLDERLYIASTPIYPEKPVGIGDKWVQEFKDDSTLGTRKAKAEFEITGVETVGTTEVVRLKMSYSEAEANGVAVKSLFAIEKASGDVLAAEYSVESFPFGAPGSPTIATGLVTEKRAEGGPIAASKTVNVAVGGGVQKAKPKTIDEIVKDYEKIAGLFTLYRKKEPNKDTLYLEVTDAQLDKLLLLQATASTGNAESLVAGDPISDLLFTITRQDEEKLVLKVPNWQWRADPNTPLGRAAKRSFPDGYLYTFKIEAKQEERKAYLIEISGFFRSDFAQISQALSGGGLALLLGGSSGGGYALDSSLTDLDSVKNFPQNLVIQTRYHFRRGGRSQAGTPLADSRSLPLLVTYNLLPLPNDPVTFAPTNGYQPRQADPRIGYFTAEYTDFSDDSKEDQKVRQILRWNLKKKDPKAALSEPEKPIVFWLDNSIPMEYRPAVTRGVLAWNRAFERIGIKNAIVLHQMPEKAEWDHADMRYNIIRWAVTPLETARNGVAIALFRENPLTGEILNAGITIDAAWTRIAKLKRRNLIDPAIAFARASGLENDLILDTSLTVSPELQPLVEQRRAALLRETEGDPRHCQISSELQRTAYLGVTALRMLAPAGAAAVREKEFTDQWITEIVAHEFGHILGLRHNFIASTAWTLDQLKDPKFVRENGIGGSVMDYNAFNIAAIRTRGVDFFSRNVGPYDLWAIEYGYAAFDPREEAAKLKKIASRSNEPGHAYQTDETARLSLDPRVVRGDVSADPLAYWERVINMSRFLLVNLDKNEPKQGESYWEFTRAFQALLDNYSGAAGYASQYIGGLTLNRNHKGDPREKPVTEPIDVAKQKKALALLNTYIFAPDALSFPEEYYTRLTTDPYNATYGADFPVADQISGIQQMAFRRLFSPTVLRRVANSEFKRGGDPNRALTLNTLFSSVTTSIWSELGKKKNIPTLRRKLQRVWLETMTSLVTSPGGSPDDATMLAWAHLNQLRGRLATAKAAPGLDDYTRYHLTESLSEVDRVLKAGYTLGGGSSSSGGGNLLQLLFGRQ